MDDPDTIPNSSGVEVDPVKRTIVLGVVNTSGMKSMSMNRKRRWDQPPDEPDDAPIVKKVLLNEECDSPDPDLGRIPEPDSSFLHDVNNLNKSEVFVSDSSVCDTGTNDLPPNNVSDRLALPPDSSSDNASKCSGLNDCHSDPEAKTISNCDSEKNNSLSSELRIDKEPGTKSISNPPRENLEVERGKNKSKSSAVVSHESEALRGIMFSYDASDSETSDSDSIPSSNAADNIIVGASLIEPVKCTDVSNKPNDENLSHFENNLPNDTIPSESLSLNNDLDNNQNPSISKNSESHIPNQVADDMPSSEANCVGEASFEKDLIASSDSINLHEKQLESSLNDTIESSKEIGTLVMEKVNRVSPELALNDLLECKLKSKTSDILQDKSSLVPNATNNAGVEGGDSLASITDSKSVVGSASPEYEGELVDIKLDPQVVKVLLGARRLSGDVSESASSSKDEESSLGPSLTDSDSNGGATIVQACDGKSADGGFKDFTVNISVSAEGNASKVFVKTSIKTDLLEERIEINEIESPVVDDSELLPDKVESPSDVLDPIITVKEPLLEEVSEIPLSEIPPSFSEVVTKSPIVEEVDQSSSIVTSMEISLPVEIEKSVLKAEEKSSDDLENVIELPNDEKEVSPVKEAPISSPKDVSPSLILNKKGSVGSDLDHVSPSEPLGESLEPLTKRGVKSLEDKEFPEVDSVAEPLKVYVDQGSASIVDKKLSSIESTKEVQVSDAECLPEAPLVAENEQFNFVEGSQFLQEKTDIELTDSPGKDSAPEQEEPSVVPSENKEPKLVPNFKYKNFLVNSNDIPETLQNDTPVAIDPKSPSSLTSVAKETLIEEVVQEVECSETPTIERSNNEFPDIAQVNVVTSSVADDSKNFEESSKTLTEEIESFDVIEEVVTCDSDRVVEEVINDDENARFAPEEIIEETQESVESVDDLVAVTDNDTSDLKVSDGDNQNVVVIDSAIVNAEENLFVDVPEQSLPESSEDVDNSASAKSHEAEKMECEQFENSIENVPEIVKMEVDEPSVSTKMPHKEKLIPEPTKNCQENNVLLLKAVTDPSVKKIAPSEDSTNLTSSAPLSIKQSPSRLEPITLKIYKDNLTIKTDGLDSPKKHKSPKAQRSPSLKLNESNSSMSPENKQLEFTLKIAKDVNTNISKATMSPKRNMSPTSTWRLESGSSSPKSPNEGGLGSLKIKLSKPSSSSILANDGVSSSVAQPESPVIPEAKEEIASPSLKLPLEMGSALKMIMGADKTEGKAAAGGGASLLEMALSSEPVAKKRGRPRKEDTPANNSPPPPPVGEGGDLGEPDTTGDGEGGSRNVRSCRARTQPILAKAARKPRGGGAVSTTPRGGARGGARGVARPIASVEEAEKIQEKLSEKEKAELAKIAARKEKMRLDRIAKKEALKAKKLARKLKDDERARKRAAEKAAAAERAAAERAPQVFEEETRMSATDMSARFLLPGAEGGEDSLTPTVKQGNHKGRMEIPIDPESDVVRVDQLAEYQWQGGELCMIQEQVSLYLGVKSFKRKYPDLKRRLVEAEERTFLEDSGLVPKSMCDLGLTAVSSAEILDIMFQDFPDKYEEFRQYVRDKQAREMSSKQKALAYQTQTARAKGELRELALEAAAMWNSALNKERREERRCSLDLQTLTVHHPRAERERMTGPPLRPGLYPVAVIPGQFQDHYKTYTPTELMYFPLNTVMYGPLKPNKRRVGTESSSSSSDDSSSSSDEEEEDNASKECKICNGEKKTNSEAVPEILLQCSQCKGLCHPTCQEITPEMLPHIKKYSWHCSNCKKCMQCKDTSKDEKMLFCDLCDRGYHLTCVSLKKAPEGRWHCSVCSYCTSCGTKDPGGSEWFYEYKKTDKGVRLYQRTLCGPCSKTALM